ncbi:MAG TPA: glycosyltransferase family 4 protein [Nitrospiraceae bacterium]|nr:glycosyltransferase family 4 protein [Nitrospiraceae bacterium]
MRILVFCDEDLSIAAGGARQVLEFARALSRCPHTIRIVAPQLAQGRQLAQEFASLSFRPVSVWRVAGLRPFSFLMASWRVLRQELAAWRPDVLLWFDSPGQMAPLLALSNHACASVLFVNGLPEEEVQGVWRLPFVRWVLRVALKKAACRVQAVVSICREIVTQMQDAWGIPPERCHVICNGVDEDRFHPQAHEGARKALGLPIEGLYIGFVGGFFPWHGLETLIEAVPFVHAKVPSATFLLVGDGQTKSALERLVQQQGLTEIVRFVGRADWAQVPTWIAACDVCVVLHRQTRSYPGDSMKLWEYLSCGRPVVTTIGPGYGDTIEAIGCGLAAKPDHARDVARQLIRLLEDPDERMKMGERGRMAVIQSHTWDARAKELEQVCSAAIGARRRT